MHKTILILYTCSVLIYFQLVLNKWSLSTAPIQGALSHLFNLSMYGYRNFLITPHCDQHGSGPWDVNHTGQGGVPTGFVHECPQCLEWCCSRLWLSEQVEGISILNGLSSLPGHLSPLRGQVQGPEETHKEAVSKRWQSDSAEMVPSHHLLTVGVLTEGRTIPQFLL